MDRSASSELHKKIEAMKLAYADLARYNGDPRFAKIPVKGILSKEYAQQRAKLIDPAKANCEVAAGTPPFSDTTYLSVVDREGNIVSLIQSNYEAFGSGIAVRGMGFVLQDRGALFSLDAASPNALAPRKRPFHTIIPAFMEHGRSAHWLRNHGRSEPAAGSCAIRFERGRLRNEYSGSDGDRAFHGQSATGLQHCDRVACARRKCGKSFPRWGINSTCGANTQPLWDAGRRFCTTRRPK